MKRTHGLDQQAQLPHRFNRGLRWVRRILMMAMGVTIVVFLRRYEITQLDDSLHEALEGRIRKGAVLFIAQVDEDTELGVGSLVEAHVDVPPAQQSRIGRQEGLLMSEIRGEPGMLLALEARNGRMEILIDGHSVGASVPLEWIEDVEGDRRLRPGPIPPDHYLLLNPNRAVPADSRMYGLVPRSRLRKVGHL
jgi:hypothetical protein